MTEDYRKKTVVVCDTQPITAEGLRKLLAPSPDLEFQKSLSSLEAVAAFLGASPPDIVVLDKGFGVRVLMEWLHSLKPAGATTAVIVWGISVTEAEALRLFKTGVRGIIRKNAGLETLLTCLRTVASGGSWLEDGVFRDTVHSHGYPRAELTPRERQVLELVEQTFKNKDIALELGICPGTVKVHLKHIFEKTGVRGRYSLAISQLKERGIVSIAS